MTHTFLQDGEVSAADIEELIRLSEEGLLRWQEDDTKPAYYAEPANSAANRQIGTSLRGLRIGFIPQRGWYYLRLTGDHHEYLEGEVGDELKQLVDCLFEQARKAIRIGGILKSPHDREEWCQWCGKVTSHREVHDAPYGLAGATMADSDRKICLSCERDDVANLLPDDTG